MAEETKPKASSDAARDKARDAELKRQADVEKAVADENAKNAPKPGEAISVSWQEPGLGR